MPMSWPTRAAAALALAVAATGVTGCSALSGMFGESATRDAETQEVTDGGSADVFSLRVGDCFDDSPGGAISDVPAVPCNEPHDNELYHSFEMPEGEWPGDEAVDAAADEQCTAEFEVFVGMDYASSTLDWFPITPLQDGWESIDDREILCAVWDPNGMIEGTLAGAAR